MSDKILTSNVIKLKHNPRNCPSDEAKSIRRIGCGCDGAYDDGCPHCTEGHPNVYCDECDWYILQRKTRR